MATHANSTTVPGVAAALMAEATAYAEGKKETVRLLAQGICNAMKEIHGGDWKVDISHKVGATFVMVIPERTRPIQRPSIGEVV